MNVQEDTTGPEGPPLREILCQCCSPGLQPPGVRFICGPDEVQSGQPTVYIVSKAVLPYFSVLVLALCPCYSLPGGCWILWTTQRMLKTAKLPCLDRQCVLTLHNHKQAPSQQDPFISTWNIEDSSVLLDGLGNMVLCGRFWAQWWP